MVTKLFRNCWALSSALAALRMLQPRALVFLNSLKGQCNISKAFQFFMICMSKHVYGISWQLPYGMTCTAWHGMKRLVWQGKAWRHGMNYMAWHLLHGTYSMACHGMVCSAWHCFACSTWLDLYSMARHGMAWHAWQYMACIE